MRLRQKVRTYTSATKIFRHHICSLFLVDENDDGSLVLPAVEDFDKTLSDREGKLVVTLFDS
jgi:hypothetical protein